jgi:EmrB/QacA subfamily drug resistance transporter
LALLALAQLVTALDYNIVYVALPTIGADLSFSASALQWVISAYAVAFGGFLLLGGRMSDLLGRRRMFMLGLSLYAGSSLLGGLATNPELLIAARALQGVGGAVLFPATLSLVNTLFAEGPQRNRALSIWAGAGASGLILGSLLGGVLTSAFGWQAVFFVNVPLAGIAILLAVPLIPADPPRVTGRRFDLPGALCVTSGATLVVFTLVQGPESGWTAPMIIASAVAGVLLLATFVLIESRSRDPLMRLRLLANRNLRAGMAITALFMATFGTLLYFDTVYFQSVHGYTALQTGFAFLVPMGAIMIGSQLGGRMITRYGVRATLVGSLSTGAVGTVIFALSLSAQGSYAAVVPGLIVLGLGQGATFVTMFAAAGMGVAAHEQGIASGMVSTGQQIGAAVGLAVLIAIAHPTGTPEMVTGGLRTAILVAAVGIAMTLLVALTIRRPRPALSVAVRCSGSRDMDRSAA